MFLSFMQDQFVGMESTRP